MQYNWLIVQIPTVQSKFWKICKRFILKSRPAAFSSRFIGYWDPIMSNDGNGYIGTFILNEKNALDGYLKKHDHYQ